MINTWFTSDTHFFHKNILEYEKEARPFSTVEEMNECLINRWNSCVNSKDIVYHLGDFCFGRANIDIASRLNGTKRLVMGNHDLYPAADYLRHFEKLYGMIFWKSCVLSHMPVHANGLGSRWLLNMHGHLHSKRIQNYVPVGIGLSTKYEYQDDPNYFCVSVEQNNLTPIHADIILDRVKELQSLNSV